MAAAALILTSFPLTAKCVLKSFHMGPEELPVDEGYSVSYFPDPCDDCCSDEACFFVDHSCDCCPSCCGAPLYDDSDREEPYDVTWPGKTESTWMRELRR